MRKSISTLIALSACLLASNALASGVPAFAIGEWRGQAAHLSGDPLLDHTVNLDISQGSATSSYYYPALNWTCEGTLDYLYSFSAQPGVTVHRFYETSSSQGCIDGYVSLIEDSGTMSSAYAWQNPDDVSDRSEGRVFELPVGP